MEWDKTTLGVIKEMRMAAKMLDDDIFMVGAVQNLAEVIGRNRRSLSSEDEAILLGVGAVFMKASEIEMKAQIQAFMAISKASRLDP